MIDQRLTIDLIASVDPMQCLHFLAAPEPSLKPPINCEPRLSPETKEIVPESDFLSFLIIN